MLGHAFSRLLAACHLSFSFAFVLFILVLFRGPMSVYAVPVLPWHSQGLEKRIRTVRDENPSEMVLWCSWLSHLSNTQKVSGSNPDRIIISRVRFLLLFPLRRSIFPRSWLV